MAVADLEIVGRRRGRICLWSRSWGSLVVAYLLVVGGGGAGNSTLWRSWNSSVVVELEFGGGGVSAWIRWWARRWELLVDTEVGFLAIIVGRRDVVWRIGNPVGMTCRRQIV